MSPTSTRSRGRNPQANVHFSSKTDDWATPQEFFDPLNDEFTLYWDVCASHINAKLPFYWTKEEDGLAADWRGKRVWMNPPYGREIHKWIAKAATGGAEICVCLLPARTDTRWFHRHILGNPHADVRFIKGRLKFGDAKSAAPFPSMVVIFRRPP
jgi:site-specific DNA-methyltransferase (adenine-specific)